MDIKFKLIQIIIALSFCIFLKSTFAQRINLNDSLHKAVKFDKYDKVVEFVEKGADPNRVFRYAIYMQDTAIVNYLIKKGAVVESIHLNAAVNQHYSRVKKIDLIKILYKNGARVSKPYNKDFSYLYRPLSRGNLKKTEKRIRMKRENATKGIEANYAFKGAYHYNTNHFLELGIMRRKLIYSERLGVYGPSYSVEFGYIDNFIIAPKLSYEYDWIYVLETKINLLAYTDFNEYSVKISPEVGFSLLGFVSLTYSYTFTLNNPDFMTDKHRISLTGNIPFSNY
jgi:hypothetical protein